MRIDRLLSTWLRGSIRFQMMIWFGSSALLLMLSFGYWQVDQQRDFIYRVTNERASAISHEISVSTASWALAGDLAGLQEILMGFDTAQDLQRAYFIDLHGKVLASTTPAEIGLFMSDRTSLDLIASRSPQEIVLVDHKNQIAVAHPVMAGERHIGWLRVEMSRDSANANIDAIKKTWRNFTLATVFLVAAVSFVLSRKLSNGLNHLMRVATAVAEGQVETRAQIATQDEVGVLARYLNEMLDTLARQKQAIRQSESQMREIVDNAPFGAHLYELMPDNKLVFIGSNRAAEVILGISHQRFIGRSIEEAFPALQGTPIPDAYRRVAATGEHFETSQIAYDADNVQGIFEVHAFQTGKNRMAAFFSDVTERKRHEEQIHHMAFYDALTKLPNRRMLNDRLIQMLATSKRNGIYGALMFLDLDNFKPLNDSHGHAVGDLLLIEVANRLRKCVREMDTVARFGGDEFVVMLSELGADRSEAGALARIVTEKIHAKLAEPYVLTVAHEGEADTIVTHHCTASIGIVIFNGMEAGQETVMKCADDAMYEAKASGRNMIRFCELRDATST